MDLSGVCNFQDKAHDRRVSVPEDSTMQRNYLHCLAFRLQQSVRAGFSRGLFGVPILYMSESPLKRLCMSDEPASESSPAKMPLFG